MTVKNTDGGSATLNAAFTVGALPTVSSISPNSVRQGQTLSVAINGTNFLTNFGTGGGSVSFGTGITVNSVTRNSATKLTANITAGANATAGGHTVTVVNSDGGTATCANCLTVVALPRVTSLTPASRPVGVSHVSVTVTGSGFQSGVAVKWSGTGITLNSLTRNSATSLTLNVTVASNATIGARDVTVTTPHRNVEVHRMLRGDARSHGLGPARARLCADSRTGRWSWTAPGSRPARPLFSRVPE